MSIQCSTCMESITANSDSSVIPCGHVFHSECIKSWLNRQPNCPHCRKGTTIDQVIKIFFSESQEETNNRDQAAGDALEANLKCIELAEKNETLQKKMKALKTWYQVISNEWARLEQENELLKNEKLELQGSNANLINENERNKKRFQKLNEEEQKVYIEKIELQRRLDEITADNEQLNGKKETKTTVSLKRGVSDITVVPHIQENPQDFSGETLLQMAQKNGHAFEVKYFQSLLIQNYSQEQKCKCRLCGFPCDMKSEVIQHILSIHISGKQPNVEHSSQEYIKFVDMHIEIVDEKTIAEGPRKKRMKR